MHFVFVRPFAVALAFLPALLNAYLIVYVLRKMSRNTLTDLFLFFLLSLTSWQLLDIMLRLSADLQTAVKIDRIFCRGWIISAPLGLHFAIAYSGFRKKLSRFLFCIMYAPAFLLIGFYGTNTSPADFIYTDFWGWQNIRNGSSFENLLLGWYVIIVSISFYFFLRKFRSTKKGSTAYKQSLLILAGYSVPAIQGIITQVVFPLLFHTGPVPLTTTFMCVFSLFTLIALNRYSLFIMEDSMSITRLIGSLSDIIIVLNNNRRIVYINEEGTSQLGYRNDELEGKSLEHILPEDANDDKENFIKKLILPALRGEHAQSEEMRLLKADGSALQVSIVASKLKNSPDNEGIMLIARDISVLKQSLEVIHRQSAYLQQLFDASPLAMAMVDVKGKVMDVNAAFEKIFGYARQEVIGNVLAHFIIPDEKKNETREFWQNADKPKSIQFETHRKRRDGELIDVCISMYPIRINGVIHGVYSIYEDITPRKEYEKDLRYKNDELVKINTELDKFVYSISHDIRSPLMSTLGVLNMAEAESLNEAEYKMYLGLIRQNIDRLDAFTTASIKYYKNTRERIIPEMVDLRDVIYECVETLRFQDEARDMDFFIDIDEDTRLLTDRNKLQIIFSNLISNAIKYRRNEGEKSYLRISCYIKQDAASLVFEDNGEGIPENKLGDIFTMFSRFSQRSSGSGLGLYIVKEVIDRLNGEISFTSDFGKGTTIAMLIPPCELETLKESIEG